MTVYRSAEHAVMRAMNVDSISLHKGAGWQNKYKPEAWEPERADNPCPMDRFDQLTQDSMTRSVLRRVLTPQHWQVLVAHFMVDLDGSTQQQRVQVESGRPPVRPVQERLTVKACCSWHSTLKAWTGDC